MVALPEALLQEASRHAANLELSTEQWLEAAVAEKLRLEEKTEEFFEPRIASASGRSLSEILQGVGDNPPDASDELE